MAAGQLPVREIAQIVGVHRTTLYRHLHPDGSPRQTVAQDHPR